MIVLVIGLLIFFGAHALPMQPELRHGLIERFGDRAYQVAFSLVSLAGLILIVVGYGKLQMLAGKNPQLWQPPVWTAHIALLLMLVSMVLLVAAYVPSNIKRIVGHPMLAGVKIWAFAHLIANGDLASVVLFGSFLAYAVVDRISVKRRAPVHGRTMARGGVGGDLIAVGGGAALYLVIVFYLHEKLIGIAPLPGLAI